MSDATFLAAVRARIGNNAPEMLAELDAFTERWRIKELQDVPPIATAPAEEAFGTKEIEPKGER